MLVEQAEPVQEVLVALDADDVGHLGRADVGRIDEHLGHRQHAVLAVEVVDGEAADADRPRRVEACRSCVTLPLSSAMAMVKVLKVEPISNSAGRHAVEPVLVLARRSRIVRVEVRQRRHRQDLAGLDVEHDARRRRSPGSSPCAVDQLVAHDVLDAQVDRQLDRLEVVGRSSSPTACRSARPWSSMYFSMPAMPWLSILT